MWLECCVFSVAAITWTQQVPIVYIDCKVRSVCSTPMAKKKSRSRTVEYDESMDNVPGEDQGLTTSEQPLEPDVYEGEEVVVIDIPPTTPDSSVDTAALEPHKPITSYVETQRLSGPNEIR